MKRYVNIYKSATHTYKSEPYNSWEDAISHRLPTFLEDSIETVRILSADEEKEIEGMKLDWTRFQTWKAHLAGFLLARSKQLLPEKNCDIDIELIEYCKRLEQFNKKEFAWEWYKRGWALLSPEPFPESKFESEWKEVENE
jgi:hypothetical protein